MAKFQGKNILFKDNQRAIFGDNNDAFIEWDESGHQLEISTVVSGVDPTEDHHLTTKYYVDNAFDPTQSGSIGNVLFGSEFEYVVDETTSSTNSSTYVNKSSMNIDVPDGDYRIGWSYEWQFNKTNTDCLFQVRLDSEQLDEITLRPSRSNVWFQVSNFYYYETLASGTYTIYLDYRSSSAGNTVGIRKSRIEFWRVQ